MKIKEITIRRGRTLYHGNYDTSRIDVTMTAELADGDNSDDAFEAIDLKVKYKLEQKIKECLQ